MSVDVIPLAAPAALLLAEATVEQLAHDMTRRGAEAAASGEAAWKRAREADSVAVIEHEAGLAARACWVAARMASCVAHLLPLSSPDYASAMASSKDADTFYMLAKARLGMYRRFADRSQDMARG